MTKSGSPAMVLSQIVLVHSLCQCQISEEDLAMTVQMSTMELCSLRLHRFLKGPNIFYVEFFLLQFCNPGMVEALPSEITHLLLLVHFFKFTPFKNTFICVINL